MKPVLYDEKYFTNMLRQYASSAELICKKRWDFVAEIGALTVLDYGSGCGFFKAFAPESYDQVDTFDIMPVPQTGINLRQYDLITFWDVLEHIPFLTELEPIFKMTNHVAITVPVKPDDVPWSEYKHFKPGEHVHHFQVDYLSAVMKIFGFKLVKHGTPECPPRQMIESFIYARLA